MASGKIRGISIELSADTSGLVKGLKSVNSDIRKTQQELRDVNRLLKLDPTNMTLLKQRTQALQTQIVQTSEKLKNLKDLEKQMKSEGVDENSEQFKALQREIIATEQELKKLNSTAGSGNAKLLQISEAANKAGESMEKAGKKLLPVTAGITAIGAASVKAFQEVDNGFDEMIKKTGATGEAAEELRGIMNNLASEIPTDFETAGKAVGEVSTRFGVTGDELEELSGKFIKFADLNNTDVSDSVDKVQKALAAFGLDADDAGSYLDRLNKTAQDTGVSTDKLTEGMVTNGAAFQEMGLSIDQATVFMGQLEKSGAKTETVMGGMRKALKKAAKEGKPLSTALEELQDTILNGTDGMDGLTAAYEVFGRSGDQIYAAVKNGTVNFKDLGKVAGDAAGSIESTFKETIDPIDEFKMALNGMKTTGAELGTTVLTMLSPAIQKLSDFVKSLSMKWKGLDDGTKKTIVTITGVVAAIGPALIVLGKVTKAISAVTKAMSTMKFAAFITNPVTLAIGAIAGLAAGVALLSKKIRNSNARLQEFDDELEDLTGRNSDLKSRIEETNEELETSITNTDSNAAAAENLSKKLDDLMGKEEKTAADKEAIKTVVEQLNELVPNLGLAYDEEADSLNKTNKQIADNIELVKQQARLSAYTEAYTESLKESAEAEFALEDAQKKLNDMMAQAPEDLQAAIKAYQEHGDEYVRTSKDFSAAYLKYADDYQRLKTAVNAVTDAEDNLTTSTKNADKWFEKIDESTEDLANAQSKLKFTNVREEFKKTFGKEYNRQLDQAISKAEKAGIEIPEKLVTNLNNGNHSVEYATSRINGLIRFDKAVKKAETDGVKIPRELYERVVAGTTTVEKGINELNGVVKFDKARKRALEDGIGIPTEAARGMREAKGEVKTAAGEVADEADLSPAVDSAGTSGSNVSSSFASGISSGGYNVGVAAAGLITTARNNMDSDASDLGYNFGKSYGDGIGSAGVYVGRKIAELVGSAKERLKTEPQSGSPSKVAMELGGDFGDGYALGILKKVRDAGRAAQALVNTPNSLAPMGYNRTGASGTYGSGNLVTNNYTYNQTNNSPAALTPSEIYRQSRNLLNLKGAAI